MFTCYVGLPECISVIEKLENTSRPLNGEKCATVQCETRIFATVDSHDDRFGTVAPGSSVHQKADTWLEQPKKVQNKKNRVEKILFAIV